MLNNPATCGTKALSATLTPWSGTAPKTVPASFTIDQGCALPAFAPGLKVAAASTAAGRPAGSVAMEITRPDGAEDISQVKADLPPGLAGSLKGLPIGTRVGSVAAVAGAGDAPVALNGDVYLTGPQDGGLAGFQMVLPGKVGPVDLGTVTVMASIKLRPDGGLTVQTSPLPRLIGGVPVSIRSFTLTLDRPGFILNASSCAEQAVRATLTGVGGTVATVSAPYAATDCAGLAFSPKLEATLGARGKTKVGSFPPLKAVITVPEGQGSTAIADVALPPMLGLDLKKLSKACGPAQFQSGTCAEDVRDRDRRGHDAAAPRLAQEPGHAGRARARRAAGAGAAADRRACRCRCSARSRRRRARARGSPTRSPASRTCRSRSSS